ncbi:MAG: hypothetical protein M1833_002987 [Piccolia ochrophora]|nr:MAG: hypothetical protein M1833_002987 [Piccolia ochrophora]
MSTSETGIAPRVSADDSIAPLAKDIKVQDWTKPGQQMEYERPLEAAEIVRAKNQRLRENHTPSLDVGDPERPASKEESTFSGTSLDIQQSSSEPRALASLGKEPATIICPLCKECQKTTVKSTVSKLLSFMAVLLLVLDPCNALNLGKHEKSEHTCGSCHAQVAVVHPKGEVEIPTPVKKAMGERVHNEG